MFQYMDPGFTTWDLANHYGPAEDFIGEFRRQWVWTPVAIYFFLNKFRNTVSK